MAIEQLNEENFEETMNAKSLVIVDFWASWCSPCLIMDPVFDELAKEYEGKLHFAKLNTDESPSIAQKNNIMSIPCLILFKGGKEADRIIGAMPKEVLKQKIDSVL